MTHDLSAAGRISLDNLQGVAIQDSNDLAREPFG
jgi:hypothetical protein